MADVITRLKIESGEYDSKIKRAVSGLQNMEQECRRVNGTLAILEKDQKQYVQSLGQMQTVSNTVRGKIGELTSAYVELSSQYKRLTEEEKKGDFGKALSSSLEQIKQRAQAAKQELSDIQKELDGSGIGSGGDSIFSKMGGKLGGAMSVFAGNLMTKATLEVANLGSEMAEMVKQGVEMAKAGEGIRVAFERLGNGQILDGLREATHGTVTDLELMKAAVKFNDFKLPIEELGTMLAFAQQKAKDTGQSVDYMVDSIVTGLGRKSLMILDNLGLSATEIKEKMAETGDMTKAVGAIIREQMQKAGDYVETAADRAAQANVDLQNKLEELGRKFLPVQEASNQLWTSMKIGILDIVGGPLARLLNGLTEAGRLRNQMNDMAGGNSSSETEKQLNFLRKTSPANRQQRYDKQLGIYTQQENAAWREVNSLKGQRESFRKERLQSGARDDDWTVYADFDKRIAEAERKAKAWQNFRADYIRGAKDLIAPPKVETPKVETPKTGSSGGSSTTTTKAGNTPDDVVAKAEKAYAETMNMAQRDLMEGVITSQKYDETIYNGQKKLAEAYNKAYEETGNEKYLKAYQETAEHVTEMQGVVDANITAQKAAEQSARELESAQKRLADAQNELADAQASGDLKKIYAAEKKVETAQVQVDARTGNAGGVAVPVNLTMSNLEAFKGHVKEEMSNINIADPMMKTFEENMSDATAIATIMQTAIQNGIDTSQFDTSGIMQKLLNGKDIPDETIQGLVQTLNEKLVEAFGEDGAMKLKVVFDVDGKQIKNLGKKTTEDAEKTQKAWGLAASSVNNLGNALAGIEDPGAKAAGTVIKAISDIALGFAHASVQAGSLGPWAWLAWLAAGTAAMATTISTVHSVTGFANGGIVPGNSFSGDNLRTSDYGINSGELILNKAQQNTIAQQLEDNDTGAGASQPYVTGDMIVLGANNFLRSDGQGELVTTRFLRDRGII